jgi:alpha-amylase
MTRQTRLKTPSSSKGAIAQPSKDRAQVSRWTDRNKLNLRASIVLILCSIGVVQCAPEQVDMEYNRGTFVTDWRDEIIYQIVVDRFADGDVNNNYNVDVRREASYHGGDWRGIMDQLDYIEDLGVTALWISPVVRNVEEDAGFASYHGYWTQSFIDTNPHFGDLDQLRRMVDACHRRGIKVILDVVTNHIGPLFYYDMNRNGQPDIVFFGGGGPAQGSQNGDQPSTLRRASEWDPEYDSRGVQGFTALGENGRAPIEWVESPHINRTPPEPKVFRDPTWYNRNGRVTVWEDEATATYEYRREQEIKGDFPGGLKDLATHKPEVRQALTEVFAYWIQEAGFDGFRIDTLKHQEAAFFDVFAPQIRAFAKTLGKRNFFMFGEAFDGDDELLGSYTHGEGVDSVFYFSAYYRVLMNVFAYGGAPSEIERIFEERMAPIEHPSIVAETAERLCALYCRADMKERPDEVDCTGDQRACVDALKERTIQRYNTAPKGDGPTDAQGVPLVSAQLLVHFLDNHDVPRFLYNATPKISPNDTQAVRAQKKAIGQARLRNALAYLLTIDGIPCIYYGTEQNLSGGPDPSNREDMWQTGFAQDGDTYRYLKALIKARKENVALRRGSVTFRWASAHTDAEIDAGLVAFERSTPEQTVLVVINTKEGSEDDLWSETRTQEGEGMSVSIPAGSTLVDVLNGSGEDRFTVGGDGRVVVGLPPRSARILVLE